MRLVLSIALVAVAACGGSVSTGDGGTDSGGGDGKAPDAGADAVTTTCDDAGACFAALAFSRVFAGDSDRNLITNANAWAQYGDDIDGKTTFASSTDVCQRASGAPAAVQTDGNAGIDNSFGENILPIVESVLGNSSLSLGWSTAIGAGQTYAPILRVDGLGSAQDYASLGGGAMLGMPLAANFDGKDVWPISSQSVIGNDATKPALALPGTMTARVYRSTPTDGSLPLLLFVGGSTVLLPIKHLVVHATIPPDNATATDGVISGLVTVADMQESMRQLLGTATTQVCSGSTWDAIAAQIAQAADILQDGTQDPNKPCDAVSIGLGFEGTAIIVGQVQNDPPGPAACP